MLRETNKVADILFARRRNYLPVTVSRFYGSSVLRKTNKVAEILFARNRNYLPVTVSRFYGSSVLKKPNKVADILFSTADGGHVCEEVTMQ